MKNMKSTMVRMTAVMLCVVCGLVRTSTAADCNWTGAVNTDWANTGNWSNGTVAANWDWVNFDANTVSGRVTGVPEGGTGLISLKSGLTQVITLDNGYLMRQNNDHGAISIAADSQDLVLGSGAMTYLLWYGSAAASWDIGAGRTVYCNCLIGSPAGEALSKTGLGTAWFTRVNSGNKVDINVVNGVARTTIDNAASTSKWSVATGATWEFGAQSHRITGLSGGGTVMSPAGDTVFMGPVTSVNGELISTNRNYVYKLDFGPGGGATVNGVVFDAAGTSGAGWVLSGSGLGPWGSDSGSGFGQMIYDFYFGAAISTLTFSNLNVGTKYEAVIYAAPSWGSRVQNATFSNGTSVVMLRATDPQYTGYYVYRFTAQTDKASISMNADTSGTYHWYGATLENLTGVVPGSRAATLTLGDANNYVFNGVISGDITLVKEGSGTQALGGSNTYSGATIISNGTVLARAAVNIGNAGFESPLRYDYSYEVPEGWTSTTPSNVGVCRHTFCPTAPPEGLQGAFSQGGSIEQAITVPADGTYELTFKFVGRGGGAAGMTVKIDGETKGLWPSAVYAGTAWSSFSTNMTLTAGARTLRFETTGEAVIDDVRLYASSGSLPSGTALSLAGSGVLDLVGGSQAVASVAGSGIVSNGTLSVTSALYPGGENVAGTLTLNNLTMASGASLYWDYGTGGEDKVSVTGTATLSANATVRVTATASLPDRVTLFECGSINAPSGVSGWTVVGGRTNSRVVIQGNLVQLVSPKGTLIQIF